MIEGSRKFVCVRIESYENEENQKIVRSHLNGSFANTAFCILAPDGEERLTRSGRGPRQVLGDEQAFAKALNDIAARYEPRGNPRDAAMPEFPSFKLALNVSAADQRLLVLLTGTEEQLTNAEKRLRPLAWDPKVQGRFHYDFEPSGAWKQPLSIDGGTGSGIYVIKPDPYGLKGNVFGKLPLDASRKDIKDLLARANRDYASTTEKKNYSDHVAEGRRKGIRIEMGMPFGEDRDGDGEIDSRNRNRRQRR
ncbi:MAG: hypothetical protein L7V86_23105 [Verrucomicrobiales bacterium]|nr:hypothetical protein [Verrucomicrobiales bacterium]